MHSGHQTKTSTQPKHITEGDLANRGYHTSSHVLQTEAYYERQANEGISIEESIRIHRRER